MQILRESIRTTQAKITAQKNKLRIESNPLMKVDASQLQALLQSSELCHTGMYCVKAISVILPSPARQYQINTYVYVRTYVNMLFQLAIDRNTSCVPTDCQVWSH